MADRIQIRRDVAANWTSINPTLAQGELGVETDTLQIKIGDGVDAWSNLNYLITATSSTVVSLSGEQTLTNKTLGNTTVTGTLSLVDNLISRPLLKDYAIESVPLANTGNVPTINLENGNFFSANVNQECTFSFTNPPTSGKFGGFVLELANGGNFTVTWPDSVDWPGGTAPTLTAAGKDQLVFTSRDAGTNWYGFVAGLDIK